MELEGGCFTGENNVVYDYRLTNGNGQALLLQEEDLQAIAELLVERELVYDKDPCDECDKCSYCTQCEDCDRPSEEAIADWVNSNVRDMAQVVLERITEKVNDMEDEIKEELVTYAKDNVCFLRSRL